MHLEYTIGNVIDIQRFNDLVKLLKVTAFVLRFVNNLKAKRDKKSLCMSKYAHASELKEAKLAWIKDNQRTITEKRLSDVKFNLNLQYDSEGVIRSYSRLKNAKIPFDMKAPIYLNREHKLVDILVYYSHLKVLHRGVKQTLTEFRSNYWVTRGRSLVKKLLRPCSTCKKLNARSYYYPQHSNLPKLRFDDRFPFSSTGVDYLGPLYCYPVYGGKKTVNRAYMALFTCASTRAVSLEVVHDALATTFTDAFSRFVSRRGCPNIVVSDNGSTFDAIETKRFWADRFVEWRPTLEAAPWMGGMYERLVASVKRCIKKVVGVRTLTFVELQTLAAEIELILNNRPIDADYDDDVEEVLTPNHLIVGRMLSTTGDENLVTNFKEDENSLSKRKQALEMVLDNFWDRWRREYITGLRELQRVRKRGGEKIREGDVVIIFDEKAPRHMWRIAKVEKLITSGDEKVRGAVLKLGKTGNTMKRPICKLYPFVQPNELNESNESSRSAVETHRRPNEGLETELRNDDSSLIPQNERGVHYEINEFDSFDEEDVIQNVGNIRNPTNARHRLRREAAIIGELNRRLGNIVP